MTLRHIGRTFLKVIKAIGFAGQPTRHSGALEQHYRIGKMRRRRTIGAKIVQSRSMITDEF
jgi:hypothetical protein